MATNWQPTTRRQWYRIISALLVLSAIAYAGVLAGTSAAQADVTVENLSVADTNKTINGTVSDVGIGADLAYEHDIPDADRRIVKLEARQPGGEWQTIDFVQESDVSGQGSGTVALEGSLVDAGVVALDDVQPALADSETTQVEIRATIEVQRSGGDPVISQSTETASLTLHDGAELTATIGGSAELTVETDA